MTRTEIIARLLATADEDTFADLDSLTREELLELASVLDLDYQTEQDEAVVD
jgi:hypothetical protein